MEHLNLLAPQLRIELDTLIGMLQNLSSIVSDTDFIKQSLAINDYIGIMSADN